MRRYHLPIDAIYSTTSSGDIYSKFCPEDVEQFHVKITAGYGMPWAYEGSAQWNELNRLTPKGMIVDREGKALLHEGNGMNKRFSEIDFFDPAASDATFRAKWAGPLGNGVWNGMLDFGQLDYVPDARHLLPLFQ